jgi:hypothetical protein
VLQLDVAARGEVHETASVFLWKIEWSFNWISEQFKLTFSCAVTDDARAKLPIQAYGADGLDKKGSCSIAPSV